MMQRLLLPILLGLGAMMSPVVVAADPAAMALTPAPGEAEPIGSYANGCIRGAQALPAEGPGFQVMNLSRRRNFGHPDLLNYLSSLATSVQSEGLGRIAIGDLGMVRGGRMVTGHASHQSGLDADIWFVLDLPDLPHAAREREDFATMVNPTTRRVYPDRFGPAQVQLVKLAAQDQRVTRIFVNPAIKLALCQAEGQGDREWLRKVRPWFGHAAHLHVRLACPADAPACIPQEAPPPGDGCDAELMSWFDPPPPASNQPPPAPPPPPAACLALFAE